MSKKLTFGASLKQFAYEKRECSESSEKVEVSACQVNISKTESPTSTVTSVSTLKKTTTTKRSLRSSSSQTSPSSSPKRRKLVYTGGSDAPLEPLLQPGLKCVFVGYNPGTTSAIKGHYYAHHSNQFWKFLYLSGCVDEPVTYEDDQSCPERFGLGLTDLVLRSTAGVTDLTTSELRAAVPKLEERIESACGSQPPRLICLVGKGIWDSIAKVKGFQRKGVSGEFKYGLQSDIFAGTRLFVVPSTSGLAASIPRNVKLELWTTLANYINSNVSI